MKGVYMYQLLWFVLLPMVFDYYISHQGFEHFK
jgi:hypothetical protein